MKKSLSYILILFLLLIFVQSCREPEKPIYYMSQEFKDYVDFPVGSWWVYEDSITEISDTVSLINSETSIVDPGTSYDVSDFKCENLSNEFYSSYLDAQFQLSTQYVVDIFEYVGIWYLYDISSGVNDMQCAYLFTVYDTLSINNTQYFNVVCIKQRSWCGDGCYYWVKHIGLIKWVDSTHVWELKNYHIN